jgi:2-C-methyl-D-erythritol 4-phosphate cytidylyltransferase/2-C-methyl-D-erythritol 2,4-cyclodiphosphate synthase
MQNKKIWSFIIVAAGSGSRMGGVPKQFRLLGGKPVYKWSVDAAGQLVKDGTVKDVVLVLPKDMLDNFDTSQFSFKVQKVRGGQTRSESVMNGLKACCGDYVLIHDAARPFVSVDMCSKIISATSESCAAVPVVACKDSLKKTDDADCICCVDRKKYWATQTPQAFQRNDLMEAIEQYGLLGTDEAEAWIASSRKITMVDGAEANFKITTSFDWLTAKSLVEKNIIYRVGHGYDVHKLAEGRKLILAGVELPDSQFGLLGHSDADIVTHTVMDAILGAAGEPDIGTIFPASDMKWKDASSIEMLKKVVDFVRNKGWRIEWVDVTLEAQTPKLGHMVKRFIDNLSLYLKGDSDKNNFNMKVKSGEGCGSVGRSECMVCHGVATLTKINPDIFKNL